MSPTRRSLLKSVVIAAGTIGLGLAPLGRALAAGGGSAAVFPQGLASGDPKPDSIILWTRAVDAARPAASLAVRLQVAGHRSFGPGTLFVDVVLIADAANDGCLRVKVTGLAPARRYFYRFLLPDGSARTVIGRTRTAPPPGDRRPVKFAFASCQDYIGRYFNSYLPLLSAANRDLDFLVHLGDFIYETNGDPSFQTGGGERQITFTDEAGAIALGDPATPFHAARSLDNYRELHQIYRRDALLQKVLARFPLVAIWDDHEFSDDCWRDNGTYFNGRRDERDVTRLRNAERAWLEYMPIDDSDHDGAPADIIDTGRDRLFPNIRIYRRLAYGDIVNLVLTDYRSYRPDHLIPEDAFPAAIVVGEAELRAAFARFGEDFDAEAPQLQPYVNWSALSPLQQGTLLFVLTQEIAAAGYAVAPPAEKAAALLAGDLAIPFLNRRLQFAGVAPIDETGRPRGLSFEVIGKIELFSSFGSRYAVIQKWFDLYALLRGGMRQNAFGPAQSDFIAASLQAGAARWTIVANSVSNTQMVLDLAQDFGAVPDFALISPILQQILRQIQATPLGTRISINVDQWAGFPSRQAQFLNLYRQLGNVVLIAGDIHATWVTDHSRSGQPLFEFTGPAISSSSFARLILNALVTTARSLGFPPEVIAVLPSLLPDLILALDRFLFDRNPDSPFRRLSQDIRLIDTDRNGIVVVRATDEAMEVTYHLLPADDVLVSAYQDPGAALARITQRRFRIEGGVLTEA